MPCVCVPIAEAPSCQVEAPWALPNTHKHASCPLRGWWCLFTLGVLWVGDARGHDTCWRCLPGHRDAYHLEHGMASGRLSKGHDSYHVGHETVWWCLSRHQDAYRVEPCMGWWHLPKHLVAFHGGHGHGRWILSKHQDAYHMGHGTGWWHLPKRSDAYKDMG